MRIALAIGLAVLFGCAQKEILPEGVLERERFTEVLLGTTLIEARMNHERMVDHSAAIAMDAYYEDLFIEQGTDSAQFARSFDHFASQPLVMKAIYDDVIARLRVLKDEGLQTVESPLAKDTTFATDSTSGVKR